MKRTGVRLVTMYALFGSQWIFVPHPALRGMWMRVHHSVAARACPRCGAAVGEPCRRRMSGAMGKAEYPIGYGWSSERHYARTDRGVIREKAKAAAARAAQRRFRASAAPARRQRSK